MADTLLELQAKKEERADQVRRYVDEYAALALEADRIKQRMDWLKGQFETMASSRLQGSVILSTVSDFTKSPATSPSTFFTMVREMGFTVAVFVTVTRLFWLPQ